MHVEQTRRSELCFVVDMKIWFVALPSTKPTDVSRWHFVARETISEPSESSERQKFDEHGCALQDAVDIPD